MEGVPGGTAGDWQRTGSQLRSVLTNYTILRRLISRTMTLNDRAGEEA